MDTRVSGTCHLSPLCVAARTHPHNGVTTRLAERTWAPHRTSDNVPTTLCTRYVHLEVNMGVAKTKEASDAVTILIWQWCIWVALLIMRNLLCRDESGDCGIKWFVICDVYRFVKTLINGVIGYLCMWVQCWLISLVFWKGLVLSGCIMSAQNIWWMIGWK